MNNRKEADHMKIIEGGVTAAKGFEAAATADGIKSQQQLYHPLLMLPQQRTFGIKPGSQLLITILSCLIFHHIHLFFL